MVKFLNLKRTKLFIYVPFVSVLLLIVIYCASKVEREEPQITPQVKSPYTAHSVTERNLFHLTSKCECKKHLELFINISSDSSAAYLNNKITNTTTQLFKFEPGDKILNKTLACDAYNSLSKGTHQKVIAFSLYGRSSRYTKNLITLTRQVKTMYPDWTMRIYHDNTIDQSLLCRIECLTGLDNVSLINTAVFCNINQLYLSLQDVLTNKSIDASHVHGMLWRYLPVGESFVDLVSSRDVDSLIIQREIESVNVWLESNRFAHIMRDHPSHQVVMMGGMSGLRGSLNRTLANSLFDLILDRSVSNAFTKNGTYPRGGDQKFLAKHVYRLIKSSALVHDSYNCRSLGGDPWPKKRTGNTDGCQAQNAEAKLCPVQCRPSDHKNWLDC